MRSVRPQIDLRGSLLLVEVRFANDKSGTRSERHAYAVQLDVKTHFKALPARQILPDECEIIIALHNFIQLAQHDYH